MALAAGTGYLVKLIYYVSIDTLKMVVQIPVPSLMALTSLMGSLCIVAYCIGFDRLLNKSEVLSNKAFSCSVCSYCAL